MGQQDMAKLADLVMKDAAFREQFRHDPRAATTGAGLELSDEDIEELESIEFDDLSDDELIETLANREGSP